MSSAEPKPSKEDRLRKVELTLADLDLSKVQGSIKAEVERQLGEHGGAGSKRLSRMREFGITAALYAVPLGLFAIAITAIIFAVSESGRNSEFRGRADVRLTQVESGIAELKLMIAAMSPAKAQNQAAASKLLQDAKENSVPIQDQIIQQAGANFIEAARTEPTAWGTALEFVNYRSFNNPVPNTVILEMNFRIPIKSVNGRFRVNIGPNVPKGKPLPPLESFAVPKRQVSPLESAKYEDIGQNLNPTGGVPYIVFDERYRDHGEPIIPDPAPIPGVAADVAAIRVPISINTAVALDGKHLRNVVLVGIEVHYSGKTPVILDNVAFVNCTFIFENAESSRRFAQTLIATTGSVSFRA